MCLKTKPHSEFGKAASNQDGLFKRCKKCSIKRSVGAADERPCDDCQYEQRCADLSHTCIVFRHWVESGVTVDRERIPDERL
jgi:hypothetical protein